MNIKDLFPSPWLHANDLPRAVTVKIARADIEKVRNPQTKQEEPRLILTFVTPSGRATSKRLICNKTQAFAVANAANSQETNDWPGTLIMLSPARAHNGQPTIAISPATAPAAQPAAQPAQAQEEGQDDDEIDEEDSINQSDGADTELWA